GTIVPTQPRVLVSGQPVATMTAQIAVAGCAFTIPGPKPQPCVTIKWLMPSARVLVMGQPAMVLPSPGPGPALCLSPEQIPQGPPIVSAVQPRVIAL
ncbi:MAG TPA: hypothetical protein VGP84_13170, partial [Gemmatimonadaceae bacterium]|nr:hypothetical protein [Gemmatimonadaceae bacterium]